ncbi:MAG: ABZJ_00895 family protein [Candidatus Acinetobacter avistercoris]|uniref:ABZJ_00895 family protein n=1 Tax=Acinetobacter sp. KS-LM10 TaxID=3120518 RepID=UPI001FA52332|nr:ABZJ_00895 family protein [Candidatus Acinetobacter avistercoris]
MAFLGKYFLRFFIYCVVLTMIFGVLAALLPNAIAPILTAFPFLIAMILVLYHFLKTEKRAPTRPERNKIAIGFVAIFFIYNIIFALLGPLIFNWKVENVVSIWLNFITHKQFLLQLITQLMMYMIPLYIITFWFYGLQSQRMAKKMFSSE